MSTSPISELIIPYDPEPLAEKVGGAAGWCGRA
jgi:hypothetical protein